MTFVPPKKAAIPVPTSASTPAASNILKTLYPVTKSITPTVVSGLEGWLPAIHDISIPPTLDTPDKYPHTCYCGVDRACYQGFTSVEYRPGHKHKE